MKQTYTQMSQTFEVTYFDHGVGKCINYTTWSEAYPAVNRLSEQFGKANLIILDNAADGTQIEQKLYQYQHGSCVIDKPLFHRRMNMENPSFEEAIGSAEEQAAARDAAKAEKAAAVAQEKARKAEEKALAKAARDEAKAKAKEEKAAAKAAKAATKAAGGTRSSSKYKDMDIIHIVKEGNPKRAGTTAYDHYAMYREGMTVKGYKDVCPNAMPCINWDVERGYITVESTPVPETTPTPVAEEATVG